MFSNSSSVDFSKFLNSADGGCVQGGQVGEFRLSIISSSSLFYLFNPSWALATTRQWFKAKKPQLDALSLCTFWHRKLTVIVSPHYFYVTEVLKRCRTGVAAILNIVACPAVYLILYTHHFYSCNAYLHAEWMERLWKPKVSYMNMVGPKRYQQYCTVHRVRWVDVRTGTREWVRFMQHLLFDTLSVFPYRS